MKAVLTPLSLLERSVAVYPDKIAEVDGERRFTYREFQERIQRAASSLRSMGVKPGDRVAVLALNSPAALEPHFAVPMLGAVLVMLNTRLQASELAWILNHCEAKVLITQPELAAVLAPVRGELPHIQSIVEDYEALVETGTLPLGNLPEPEEDGLLSINYTSGTTGFPKGVMFTHRGAWINAIGEMLEMGLGEDSVYLWTLPIFHCNGWCFPWAVTGAGGRHVCLPKVDPERIVRLIEQEGVTHLCGAPVVVSSLAHHCASRGIRFSRSVKILTAGAPPSPAVLRAATEIGLEMLHAYGLTETYGPYTICAWRSDWNRLPAPEQAILKARQGVPYIINGCDLRVVDQEMADVPADGETLGEVVMRGNNVMTGYYGNPKATEEAFRGGWFHSGDLAVMHKDGYIEIRDRQKDIIISGGENISSVEVEKVIYEHPAVMEAAVVAVPDEKWGEAPKAFVGLKEGASATEQEIIDFCRSRLAHFKCPKSVSFGALPKTATGKVRKNELRAGQWVGRAKGVN
ncbi:MAG: long-chain-fatty-acid--CoA ligase [Acidobacteriia bacterium]|nr:long-chain-fatty-acid--CoA ligase [Terriglobia bacterium]